jgi:protein-disulfide isomerase
MRPSRLAVAACLLASFVCAQTAEKSKSKPVVATIAGKPIYEDELEPLIKPEMQKLRHQEYEIKATALDRLIQQKILEAEAARQGISVEALIKQKIQGEASVPSDAEVEALYAQEKDRLGRPLSEIKTELRDAMIKDRMRKAFQEYMAGLKQKNGVTILIAAPRIAVSHDPARVRGNPKAPITIVEFSDFQCGFCQRVTPTLRLLLAKYDGQVSLAYRDFPLREIHPQAQLAAEASRCAGDQGKFWEYHDALFANSSKLDKESLAMHARSLQLDGERFDACLESGKFKAAIDSDMQGAEKAGVSATPAFFVNGVMVEGAQPIAAFEKIIDAERRAGTR